jgi:hypothetical protein
MSENDNYYFILRGNWEGMNKYNGYVKWDLILRKNNDKNFIEKESLYNLDQLKSQLIELAKKDTQLIEFLQKVKTTDIRGFKKLDDVNDKKKKNLINNFIEEIGNGAQEIQNIVPYLIVTADFIPPKNSSIQKITINGEQIDAYHILRKTQQLIGPDTEQQILRTHYLKTSNKILFKQKESDEPTYLYDKKAMEEYIALNKDNKELQDFIDEKNGTKKDTNKDTNEEQVPFTAALLAAKEDKNPVGGQRRNRKSKNARKSKKARKSRKSRRKSNRRRR